jgi:glutamate-5-semialdehyde dehydrogenase
MATTLDHTADAAVQSVTELVHRLAREARTAQAALARIPAAAREHALKLAAAALRRAAPEVLAANARDLAAGEASGLSGALLDRLRLDPGRLEAIAAAVADVASLPDPTGAVIDRTTRPNGMVLERVRIPIGVIGIIYESRPNVTADAAALCVRAGNAVLLRGGTEAVHSNRAIHAALVEGLVAGGVPAAAVQFIPTQDRAAVGALLGAASLIDMIVPRGG